VTEPEELRDDDESTELRINTLKWDERIGVAVPRFRACAAPGVMQIEDKLIVV
jgi:hypothetical protein